MTEFSLACGHYSGDVMHTQASLGFQGWSRGLNDFGLVPGIVPNGQESLRVPSRVLLILICALAYIRS